MTLTRRAVRRARGDRGAAAVEFALIAPILFLLVFGIIDFGLLINSQSTASNAAREGARVASLGGNTAAVTSSVTPAMSTLINAGSTTTTVTCLNGATACSIDDATSDTGATVTVKVTYTYKFLTPVAKLVGLSGTLTFSKSSQTRIE